MFHPTEKAFFISHRDGNCCCNHFYEKTSIYYFFYDEVIDFIADIGYRWLSLTYSVDSVHPMAVESQIGRSHSTSSNGDVRVEVYLESYRPLDSFSVHLTFAFKYEGIHLEFLAPDNECDSIIRSIRQNGNVLSNQLCKRYPIFKDKPVTGERLVRAVHQAFVHLK